MLVLFFTVEVNNFTFLTFTCLQNQALSDELAKYKKEYGRIKHKLNDASRKMEVRRRDVTGAIARSVIHVHVLAPACSVIYQHAEGTNV